MTCRTGVSHSDECGFTQVFSDGCLGMTASPAIDFAPPAWLAPFRHVMPSTFAPSLLPCRPFPVRARCNSRARSDEGHSRRSHGTPDRSSDYPRPSLAQPATAVANPALGMSSCGALALRRRDDDDT
jgi:hypothetical protein